MLAALWLAICLPLLGGCTPEKAEALLTAIKAFEAQSNQALGAYEDLFKAYRAIRRESPDELFVQAYDAAGQHGAAATFEIAVQNVGQLEGKRAATRIENEFLQLRAAYALLRTAYEALPQGSLLGARYVSCGRTAVGKLTRQLVNFSSDIDASPLYPAVLRQDYAEFRALAAKGAAQKPAARQKFDAFHAGVAAYEQKHHEAIVKTLAAVEQGRRLDRLLAQYDAVTVSDVLGLLQYGFAFAGTLEGLDVARSAARLKAVRAEMEQNEYWRRLETVPLAAVAECTMTVEKEN